MNTTSDIQIIRVDSYNKDFLSLVRLLDHDLDARYGSIQAQYNKYNQIEALDTVVIGTIDKQAVGCACFKIMSEEMVEVKRMFVKNEFRGSGIAKLILQEIEKWATEKGFKKAVLETGIKQIEAIRFYTKSGYHRIDNYGQYAGNMNSICMRKELGHPDQ